MKTSDITDDEAAQFVNILSDKPNVVKRPADALITRLRRMADINQVGKFYHPLYAEAADEIARLRIEVRHLRINNARLRDEAAHSSTVRAPSEIVEGSQS